MEVRKQQNKSVEMTITIVKLPTKQVTFWIECPHVLCFVHVACSDLNIVRTKERIEMGGQATKQSCQEIQQIGQFAC